MPKRILHIISGLRTGGAERMLVKLLRVLKGRGQHHVVISLMAGGNQIEALSRENVTVFAIDMAPNLSVFYKLPGMVAIARRIRPDLIQGWMYHGNIAASLVSRWLYPRPPAVWNIRHSIYDLKYEKFATRMVIKLNLRLSHMADKILYNSSISRHQHEALGFKQRGAIVPNGFDVEEFAPKLSAKHQLRKELHIDPDAFIIGHVARFHPMKDHANFLKAAAVFNQKHGEARFLLAGPEVTIQNPELGELCMNLGLSAHVHFLGERSDVSELLNSLDIFSTSSAWGEAFPNVLGEAMACGIPCVATDVGDSALIIGDPESIVSPRVPEELAAAWARIYKKSSKERIAMGAAGRRRIVERYSLGTIAEQYAKLYADLTIRTKPA
jgi:glycosyltransferase involved in cell wall biosynthesis